MEEYLQSLLEQVRCKKARDEIEKEIRAHITDQAEAYILDGMNEQEAVQEAVRDMGDPVEVGVELDKIHRPKIEWSMIGLIGIISLISIILHFKIGVSNKDLGQSYVLEHTAQVFFGFLLMNVVYHLDYSILAKYAVLIESFLLSIVVFGLFYGDRVEGATVIIFPDGFHLSIIYLMYLLVPFFAAILYHYRGQGRVGILKAILWMIVTSFFASQIPSLSLSLELFLMEAVILSIAVWLKWFRISAKLFLTTFWGIIILFPLAVVPIGIQLGNHGYLLSRLKVYLGDEASEDYIFQLVSQGLSQSKMIGKGNADLVASLPSYNSDFILTYISNYYGVAIMLVVLLILVGTIIRVFSVVLKQKNQLGLLMGIACGLVIFTTVIINIVETFGVFPRTRTSLPFLSYNGTETYVNYILIGIVLSVYRYKDILPSKPEYKPFLQN